MKPHAALVAAAALALSGAAIAKHHPTLGTSTVVATIPAPGYPGPIGYPEGLAVHGNRAYVGTSATFGTAGSAASKIYAFNRKNGDLEKVYEMEGQDLSAEHALSNIAFDGDDRMYVLDTQRGVVRMRLHGNQPQEVYAPIPDLPACNAAPPGADCSPTAFDRPPLANDLAFDEEGYLYVTDSFQATIWRVPPGGGEPEIWFQHPVLDDVFGPNGIRISPDGMSLVFAMTTTGFDFGTPGHIFKLPLVDHPDASELSIVHTYGFEAPDGFAFGASGKLYVALALSNQISVLAPDGTEEARYGGPATSSSGPVPYDAPASIAFDDSTRSILVTNHALFSGVASHFVLFDVYVDDRAYPLERPELP